MMRFPHNSPMVELYGRSAPRSAKEYSRANNPGGTLRAHQGLQWSRRSQPPHPLLHPLLADVGVHLGGGDALVAQQGLEVQPFG